MLDGLLGISLVMHSHIGVCPSVFLKFSRLSDCNLLQFDSMIVDYLHKRKFPIIGPIATWTLRTATLGVLIGVYQFNTNDIGMIFLSLGDHFVRF